VIGSSHSADQLLFELGELSLTDHAEAACLNARVRWATQSPSRLSRLAAERSVLLQSFTRTLDTKITSSHLQTIFTAGLPLIRQQTHLTTAGLDVLPVLDNRHQLLRDSNPSRPIALSLRSAAKALIHNGLNRVRVRKIENHLAQRSERNDSGAPSSWFYARPLLEHTNFAQRAAGPLPYLRLGSGQHDFLAVRGNQLKLLLRAGRAPLAAYEFAPNSHHCCSCKHSLKETPTHFINCSAYSEHRQQLFSALDLLLANVDPDHPDPALAPLISALVTNPSKLPALVLSSCPISLARAFPETNRPLTRHSFVLVSTSCARFLAACHHHRKSLLPPPASQTPAPAHQATLNAHLVNTNPAAAAAGAAGGGDVAPSKRRRVEGRDVVVVVVCWRCVVALLAVCTCSVPGRAAPRGESVQPLREVRWCSLAPSF